MPMILPPTLPIYTSPQDTEANVGSLFTGSANVGTANASITNLVDNTRYCGAKTISTTQFPSLATLTFPFLVQSGNGGSGVSGIVITSHPNLVLVKAPAYLKYIGAAIWNISSNAALTTVFFPKFTGSFATSSGLLRFVSNTVLASLALPALAKLAPSGLTVSLNPALTTFSAPLDTVVLQAPTATLFDFTANALTQSSVDTILIQLAANLPFTSATSAVSLAGGTNATPSAAGLAAKVTLTARGVIVTNN